MPTAPMPTLLFQYKDSAVEGLFPALEAMNPAPLARVLQGFAEFLHRQPPQRRSMATANAIDQRPCH